MRKYISKVTTHNISEEDGSIEDLSVTNSRNQVVSDGVLKARINGMNKFTTIEFIPR